ncbi:hypothetical protein Glove_801g11 [Diversispora epigaea]|uniref:Transcriptional coactivator p15 (PC4) C-terminal domain-containing protein n=1 Tax=Diversispora epigaea TaxID=1348612 RepID=A0A397FYU3_9GLOM|nr:hypothetical protein Glove_801g11 [Diversispora epigaea]
MDHLTFVVVLLFYVHTYLAEKMKPIRLFAFNLYKFNSDLNKRYYFSIMPKRKNDDYIEDSDEAAGETSTDKDNKDTNMEPSGSNQKTREPKSNKKKAIQREREDDDRGENGDGEAYFKLSEKKRVTVRKFKNMILIDFREFFTNSDGDSNPTKKGIALQPEQWNKLKEFISDIDEEIENLK